MGRGRSRLTRASSGNALQDHFNKENQRIDAFMSERGYASIEMDNGQILEHYTMKDAKRDLKDFKQSGDMYEDFAVDIQYTDGTIASYRGGDDTSKMKLTNINGVIVDNPSTTGFAGKGVKIENYKELYPNDYPDSKGYDDDWRMDFEYWKKR